MDDKLENAIIRTYKKLREKPKLTDGELIGIFINYYYSETGLHGSLDTRHFRISKVDDIVCIISSGRAGFYYRTNMAEVVCRELREISTGQFHALWLRSNFEDPYNNRFFDPVVNTVISVSNFIDNFEKENTNHLTTKTI
jgi:hypothetical protein